MDEFSGGQGNLSSLAEDEADANGYHSGASMPVGYAESAACLQTKSLYVEAEPLLNKDISVEVRGQRDLELFAEDESAAILLDVRETNLEAIVDQILQEMVDRDQIPEDCLKEATEALIGRSSSILSVPEDKNETEVKEEVEPHFHKYIQGRNFSIPVGKISALSKRAIGFARLCYPINLGAVNSTLTRFVVVVLGPTKEEKPTKSVLETARTFSALLSDSEFYAGATDAQKPEDLRKSIRQFLDKELALAIDEELGTGHGGEFEEFQRTGKPFGALIKDIRRKAPWYISDYTDGFVPFDIASIVNYLSTIVFLYFSVTMPIIAFASLNNDNTKGDIGVIEGLVSQTLCGLVFAVFAGQPLTIIMTTGPLTIYIGVLFSWTTALGISFLPFYAWTGIWTAIILLAIVAVDGCAYIKYVGAFTEEIFALLISAIFVGAFVEPLIHSRQVDPTETFLLVFILAWGTFLLGTFLLTVKRSFLLRPLIRMLISDFGAATAIIVMSGLRAFFPDVEVKMLDVPESSGLVTTNGRPWLIPMLDIPTGYIFLAIVPAFLLTTLFFLDQNISTILVTKPQNKLKKGSGYHLDLTVVALLVVVCSIFGLPWAHAALPQSPMHARALADVEEYEAYGRRYERVVKARETRITALVVHVFVGISILLKHVIALFPESVLFGFFLYMAVTPLDGNQMWQRVLLIFTQREKYPPNHIIRRVKIRRVFAYTFIQVVCLTLLWFVKANFYLGDTLFNAGLLFPFVIALFVPLRLFVLPKMFSAKELLALGSDAE